MNLPQLKKRRPVRVLNQKTRPVTFNPGMQRVIPRRLRRQQIAQHQITNPSKLLTVQFLEGVLKHQLVKKVPGRRKQNLRTLNKKVAEVAELADALD